MLSSLYRKLSQYKSLLSDINELVRNLRNVLNPLSNANKSLQENFKYNDQIADKGKIMKCRAKLEKDINSLEKEIIPSIERNIQQIKKEIADLEAASTLGGA